MAASAVASRGSTALLEYIAAAAGPPSPEHKLDHVALGLVILQSVLLYLVARTAERLDGKQLLRAAQIVRDRAASATRSRREATANSFQMNSLTPAQEAILARARQTFLDNGGDLDHLERPFLLRFLVGNNWNEQAATRQLEATARWRARDGASEIRRKLLAGAKPAEHTALLRLLSTIGIAPSHRTTARGNILSILHVGSFDPERWFGVLNDRDFADAALHLFEHLAFQADLASDACGALVNQEVILDYEGLGWHHLNPRIFFRLSKQLKIPDAYYPEFIGSALCVNAPSHFIHLWGMVSPLLSQRLRSRVTTVPLPHTAHRGTPRAPPHPPHAAFLIWQVPIDDSADAIKKLAPPASLPRAYAQSALPVPSLYLP